MKAETVHKLQDVLDLLGNPEIKIVSFDLFDTLLCRPTAFPRDLIELYDEDFRKIINGFPLYSFRKDRFGLEDDFRKTALISDHKREEITFDEIYAFIQTELALEGETVLKLKNRELEIEKRHLKLRRSAIKLFDAAKNLGKTVIIVSDMYLPASFLKETLAGLGVEGTHGFYVSSEFNQKKKSGHLFRRILDETHCLAKEMLHIGDNVTTDIKPALELGIRAVHFPKALDVFLELEGNRHLSHEKLQEADLGYRVIVGLMANKIFDDPYRDFERASLFNGEPWLLGYVVFGPLMFFMAKWILEECLKDDIDEVLFLARDGHVLQQVFDRLAVFFENGPKSKYMFASRNAFLPQTLSQEDFITLTRHYVGISGRHITLRKLLVDRFGLEIDDDLISFFERCGLTDFDVPIGSKERKILRALRKLHAKIVSVNREKLQLAKAYFEQFIDKTKNQVCFDLGWRGTSQLYLNRLLDTSIEFFYFTCNSFAFASQAKFGFRAKPYMPFTNPFFLDFDALQLILETVFGDPESSTCVGFEQTQACIVPKFSGNTVPSKSQEPIKAIHQGIVTFVEDVIDWMEEDVRLVHAIPQHLVTPLVAFMATPHKIDTAALDQICSENILASDNMLFLLDHWEAGRRSLKNTPKLSTTRPTAHALTVDQSPNEMMRFHLKQSFHFFRNTVRERFPRFTRFLLSPLYDLFIKLFARKTR